MINDIEIVLHQTHFQVADFASTTQYLSNLWQKNLHNPNKQIHIFPELFIGGYPLNDLCLQKIFIEKYQEIIFELQQTFSQFNNPNQAYLLGALEYHLGDNEQIQYIFNSAYLFHGSCNAQATYQKQLLPNYDIFDEKKYFTAGTGKNQIFELFGKSIGLLICEDMWSSLQYNCDPTKQLYQLIKKEKKTLDLIINISASPFYLGKKNKRINRAKDIVSIFNCPFVYVNRVGAEDEIVFDGNSFIIDQNLEVKMCSSFKADIFKYNLPDKANLNSEMATFPTKMDNTWENLFQNRLDYQHCPPQLKKLTKTDSQELISALTFSLQDYAKKSGFQKFTVALSGGIDSALVLYLAKLSLEKGHYLEAIYMPSRYSSSLSEQLSQQLCQELDIPLFTISINQLHQQVAMLFKEIDRPLEGLSDENIQSRLRGALVYTRSNQINSMVINTSNKSEIAVGYSTQYGDSVGAISLLGDLYKSEVYQLAQFINENFPKKIPTEIITRPATAELRLNQEDSQSLPPYQRLDAILEAYLSHKFSKKDLINLTFEPKELNKVWSLLNRSEFKRFQFCPIVKCKTKSFGYGYRVPITKNNDYLN